MMRLLQKLLPIAAATALMTLGGCVSFGEDPPPFMMTLSADQMLPSGVARAGDRSDALVVEAVAVPQKLNTLRVPVARNGTTIAYLKDAFWVERPNRLFGNLLMETISAKADRLVLAPAQAGTDAKNRLEGELVEFGLDGPALQVVVVFDALASGPDGQLRKRRFEAREDVAAAEAAPVGEALNTAANRVAADVADWFAQ